MNYTTPDVTTLYDYTLTTGSKTTSILGRRSGEGGGGSRRPFSTVPLTSLLAAVVVICGGRGAVVAIKSGPEVITSHADLPEQ